MAINGTNGNDDFDGTRFDDEINGFGGSDFFQGSRGQDRLDGGGGIDRVDYAFSITHGAFGVFPTFHEGEAVMSIWSARRNREGSPTATC